MRRATITIPDDLDHELEDFLASQDAPPSLTNVMQTALRNYLEQRKWSERGFRSAESPFAIPTASQGSGKTDISTNHDQYLQDK